MCSALNETALWYSPLTKLTKLHGWVDVAQLIPRARHSHLAEINAQRWKTDTLIQPGRNPADSGDVVSQ